MTLQLDTYRNEAETAQSIQRLHYRMKQRGIWVRIPADENKHLSAAKHSDRHRGPPRFLPSVSWVSFSEAKTAMA
jgi:hypothetical protein